MKTEITLKKADFWHSMRPVFDFYTYRGVEKKLNFASEDFILMINRLKFAKDRAPINIVVTLQWDDSQTK